MRRRLIAVAIVVALAGAAGVGWQLWRDDGTGPRTGGAELDIAGGERAARSACAHLRAFEALVGANARADRVQDELTAADEAATAAAEADPRWRSLASGTDALVLAIDDDDARAARVGIDVVRAQCQSLD